MISFFSIITLSIAGLLFLGVATVIIRHVYRNSGNQRYGVRGRQLAVETLQSGGGMARELNHDGEVNAAVVLRHRFSEPPPTRSRRRHRLPREAMNATGSRCSSSSSSDIDPVALRQKPFEVEMTEEMRMVEVCAVEGVPIRGEEVELPEIQPRGGVIFRLPRSAVTPASMNLSRSISPTPSGQKQQEQHPAAVNESRDSMSLINFSRPVTPVHTREGGFQGGSSDAVATTFNIDAHMLSSSSCKRKVRNDSFLVYGHALYTREAHEHLVLDSSACKNHHSLEAPAAFCDANKNVQGPGDTAGIDAEKAALYPFTENLVRHSDPGVSGLTDYCGRLDTVNMPSSSSSSLHEAFLMPGTAADVIGSVRSENYDGRGKDENRVVFGVSFDYKRGMRLTCETEDAFRPPPIGASVATMAPGSVVSPGTTPVLLQQTPSLPFPAILGGPGKDMTQSVDT